MADSSKSLIECVSDVSDEDEDTVESDSCKKASIFRAFLARFGSILHRALVSAPAGDNFHTKVQLEFNSSDRTAPKKGQTGCKLYPAGMVTR